MKAGLTFAAQRVKHFAMHRWLIAALLVVLSHVAAPARAEKAVPYWASIGPDQARMRSGPGREFPATWMYQRAGLPVKVIKTYPNWRQIEDPDGTTGWMQANMISERRTGLVTGAIRTMHAQPSDTAPVVWRVEPGVVGRVSQCASGWCLFDVKGRIGYIRIGQIWGVAPDENLP